MTAAMQVGDEVIVQVTADTPAHLAVAPHTVITKVLLSSDGPLYWVTHHRAAKGARPGPVFGPLTGSDLLPDTVTPAISRRLAEELRRR